MIAAAEQGNTPADFMPSAVRDPANDCRLRIAAKAAATTPRTRHRILPAAPVGLAGTQNLCFQQQCPRSACEVGELTADSKMISLKVEG